MKMLRMIGGYGVLATVASLAPIRAAQLSVAACTTDGTGTARSTVGLASLGKEVAGVQFDLEYDPAQVHLAGSWNTAQREASKDLSRMVSMSPAVQRVLIAGRNTNRLFDGGLLDLKIELTSTNAACAGTVRLTRAMAVSPDGVAMPLSVTPEPGSPVAIRAGRPRGIGAPRPTNFRR